MAHLRIVNRCGFPNMSISESNNWSFPIRAVQSIVLKFSAFEGTGVLSWGELLIDPRKSFFLRLH